MKVKKDIYQFILSNVLKLNNLSEDRYKKVYLKLFNKYLEGKPRKYDKEYKASIEQYNQKSNSISTEHLKVILDLFESENFNWWAKQDMTLAEMTEFKVLLASSSLKESDRYEVLEFINVFATINFLFRKIIIFLAGKENTSDIKNIDHLHRMINPSDGERWVIENDYNAIFS